VSLQLVLSVGNLNTLSLVKSWWVQGQIRKNLWDHNVKLIFLILNEGEIVKLVFT